MWKFLKAVGKVIFYVVFSPVFLLLWLVDNTINGRPEGYDKILGQKLPPGVRYFKGSNTFAVTDVGAYFGSIARPSEQDIARANKRAEGESGRKKSPMSGIKVSAGSASFEVEDVGEYFSYIPEHQNKSDNPS